MDRILIKSDDQENYGSLDTSPECKVRPLNDKPYFGSYIILAKMIVLGPHWPLFVCAMIGFDIYAYIVLKHQHNLGHDITFGILIAIIQTICYFLVGITNPGISNDITLNEKYLGQLYTIPNKSNPRNVWYCERCQKIQPARSDHCAFCRVCVTNYDHHCPWTGKCIGGENILQFWAFLISTVIFFTYFINMMLSQRQEKKLS